MTSREIGNNKRIIPYVVGKAFCTIQQAEEHNYNYVGQKSFSVRKRTIVKVGDLLKKMALFCCKQGLSIMEIWKESIGIQGTQEQDVRHQ